MRIDKEKRIWFSKEEMRVLIGVLHVISFEMWKSEKYKTPEDGKRVFPCSVADVKYVKEWFTTLYAECKRENHIFLSEDIEKRLQVVDIALQKCKKHFEEYEVEGLVQIGKQELKQVADGFKRLVLELESVFS